MALSSSSSRPNNNKRAKAQQLAAMARPWQRLTLCLLIAGVLVGGARGATLLRTATVLADDHPSDWLSASGPHRKLLGDSECADKRWGPLCNGVQLLLQLAEGHTHEEAAALAARLRADGTVISATLPERTWLVVAQRGSLAQGDNAQPYAPHVLLPYAAEYKIAPEWHPILELVHREHAAHAEQQLQQGQQQQQQQQQHGKSKTQHQQQQQLLHQQEQQQQPGELPADAHVQLHRRVLRHTLVQQLQLHRAGADVRARAAERAPREQQQQLLLLEDDDDAAAPSDKQQQQQRPLSPPPPQHKIRVGVHFPDLLAEQLTAAGHAAPEGFHPAAAAAADWAAPLAALVAADGRDAAHRALCEPELLVGAHAAAAAALSPSALLELDVAVCPQDLGAALAWLSRQAGVSWLAPRPRLFLQNAVASAIVQSATVGANASVLADAHPFWDAGLDGRGQVIGIGDSGIDMDSCFFSDPAVPFAPPSGGADGGGAEWKAPAHRKVVYYWAMADPDFRDLVGHGTHTSGSLVGLDPANPAAKATGAAKGARIAFVDLSRTAAGDVNAPADLEQGYYPNLAAAGASVFSDSWGSSTPVYDFQASRVDSYLYKHQDAVAHFAAGNYGENDNLDTTITSPATAKNVITVGATKSLTPNYVSQTIAPVFFASVRFDRAGRAPQYVGARLVKADFGPDGSALSGKGLRVLRANPPTACGALDTSGGADYTNAIVLAKRGACLFSEKAAAGAAAGAAAVVVVNDRPGGYFKMDAQTAAGGGASAAGAASTPLFAVTQRLGEELWALFDNADAAAGTIERYASSWEAYEDIASFSSFGPTADGRIKPDVVCPGELVSAASADAAGGGGTCATGRKSGTSMATPMVAAHTAIARQYFSDGFYPSGAAVSADGFTPSGPLLKAVIMGGACDLKGNTEQYLPLEDSPSMRQGFGRLCLCNSLKLSGTRCANNLQVVDRAALAPGEAHKYCLRTTGAGDVRVTVVWYDWPAPLNANTNGPLLVNDLDLVVTSGGMGGQAFYGNMGSKPDARNTAERVWLKNPPAGGLEISVTAKQLSPLTPTQAYALVVQGAFADALASPNNPDKSAPRALGSGCAPAPAAVVVERAPAPAPAADAVTVAAAAAASPAPAAADDDAAKASPSPAPASPAPANDSLSLLLGTMQTGSGSSGGARRLSWVPTPPATLAVRVPALVCRWLNASNLGGGMVGGAAAAGGGAAAADGNGSGDGSALVHVPFASAVAGAAVALLLAVALLAVGSRRLGLLRGSPGRASSLTSALCKDLSLNKRRGLEAAREATACPGAPSSSLDGALSEALLSGAASCGGDDAARAVASSPATPRGGAGRCPSSASGRSSSSSGGSGGNSCGWLEARSEPGSPSAFAASLRTHSLLASPLPSDEATPAGPLLLPGVASCPAAGFMLSPTAGCSSGLSSSSSPAPLMCGGPAPSPVASDAPPAGVRRASISFTAGLAAVAAAQRAQQQQQQQQRQQGDDNRLVLLEHRSAPLLPRCGSAGAGSSGGVSPLLWQQQQQQQGHLAVPVANSPKREAEPKRARSTSPFLRFAGARGGGDAERPRDQQ